MRVYISTDIEGVGCVVRSEHSSPTGREFEFARQQMTAEVNSAAAGAFKAGATEVVVADAHNVGLNLLPDRLDERLRLVMGSPRPLSMMEGVQQGFDAVFLVGYHAKSGTVDGNLAHIFLRRISEVKLNGLSLGEIGLSAALAGYYRAPVALVTGDDRACAEARELLSGVQTAVVKEGIGAYAALCLHPKKCLELIQDAAAKALAGIEALEPLTVGGPPINLEVTFTTASAVDQAARLPGAVRTGGTTVYFQGQDLLEAFQAFNLMADLTELVPFI